MRLTDGGLAFPQTYQLHEDDPVTVHEGMSLRDWFAGQALAGWGEGFHGFAYVMTEYATDPPTIESIAATSYRIADAMLKAREATK
jgi:hypothetical protein